MASDEQHKSQGQIAYEEDVRRHPYYDHAKRFERRRWDEIGEDAQWSWELNPTPRPYPNATEHE